MSQHGTVRGNFEKTYVRAREVNIVIFDVDGVLTDNRVLEGGAAKPKCRSYYDGQGISLLRAVGVRVCFVTNEKGKDARHVIEAVRKWNQLPSSKNRAKKNGWPHVKLFTGRGGKEKVEAVGEWLKEFSGDWSECAAMGDDIVDIPLLRRVRLKAAPASAELVIREMADFVSRRPGGYGAVRDFANFLLEARGIDVTKLPFH